jgi:hypothetical protein
VRNLHVLTPDRSHELQIMISWYTQRAPGIDHLLYQSHRVGNPWTAVHQVPKEDRLSPIRRLINAGRIPLVAELSQQLHELFATAVNISNDVERPMLALQVVPKRLTGDVGRSDLFRGRQFENVTKTLTLEAAYGTP